MELIFCPIDDQRVKRENFDCGVGELNEYLQKYARQNHKKGIAKTVSLRLSSEVGIFAVKVDAKNESAKAFYLKYGFIPLENDPLSLFIPIASLAKMLA